MYRNPNRVEIDHHTIKLIIGLIALSLATLTSYLSGFPLIDSISASYHRSDWPRNIFVGFLFAIAALMFAYNGRTLKELVLGRIAAVAAIGVAVFPCYCDLDQQGTSYIHFTSAAIMFIILAIFCNEFRKRASKKGHIQAVWRARIYTTSGLIIIASISVMVIDAISIFLSDSGVGIISSVFERLTFFCEAAGLIAFGIAWLTASRTLPIITNSDERVSLSPYTTRDSPKSRGQTP